MTSSDVIGLVSLVCLVIVSIMSALGLKKLSDHNDGMVQYQTMTLSVIKASTVEQRMMTCIMSIPQEKREDEYRNPSSFCHQMSALQ